MRTLCLALLAAFLEMSIAQPATLTLRAKLRDFKDYYSGPRGTPPDPAGHPDFENDVFDANGCGGSNLGYVRNTLAETDPGDTAAFRGENRGPVLERLAHPITGSACFTSFDRFKEWFSDKPSVNRSFYVDLEFTPDAQGRYTFSDNRFLPLNKGAAFRKFQPTDPDPFGPLQRNDPAIMPDDVWGFTMELHTTFTYTARQGQVFNFRGDDDVWVFINGRLAIDLGGLHTAMSASVDLDARAAALGLVDGQSYPLDFFFAERHTTGSTCQITTSLHLVQKPTLPAPVATPSGQSFRSSIEVRLAVPDHPDAQIRYTTDNTEPTESSPIYGAALAFTGTTTLKAKAFKAGFLPSATMTEVYTLEQVPLPPPVATPPGQTFNQTLTVALSVPGHPEADIRYTLDNTEPGPASLPYSGPLTFTQSTVLKARAFATGWLPSGVRTETYVLELLRLPAPVATPPGQEFKGNLPVTLAVPGHADAVIRYTRDGSLPDSTSPVYAGPLSFGASDTLKARAFKPGWLPSDVLTEVYVLLVPPNVIGLRMDSTVIRGVTGLAPYPDAVSRRPIALVGVDAGASLCLNCAAGTEGIFLQPRIHPEWVVTSRSPFTYNFQIYDHLGQFVVAQSGAVTREMVGQLPPDAEGYRVFRFRWVPVARDGRHVGTGAYILRGNVVSERPANPTADPGRWETSLLRTFGFLRQD